VLAIAAAAITVLGIGAAVLSRDDGGRDQLASETAGDTYSSTTMALGGDAAAGTTGGSVGAPELSPGGAAALPDLAAPLPADGDKSLGYDTGSSADSGSTAGRQAGDSAMVVKTGSLTLEVDRGTFDRTVDVVSTKAAGLGGYVAQSSSTRNEGRASGTIVVRVPSASFDGLLSDLRKLGDIVSEDSQGVDVTGQHTDVEARLNALRATRDKLGTILAQAKTVDETLAVQDRVTGVQTQIEQLEGQLRALDDQVGMGSITLSLSEPGAERIDATGPDDGGLGGAWADARHRFGDGMEDLLSWSGSAAVVALVGLLLLGALRLAWPRLRRMLL
jgi:hypothetical protein